MISKFIAPLLAMFALGGMFLPGLSTIQQAQAQQGVDAESIVDGVLEDVLGEEEEEEENDGDDGTSDGDDNQAIDQTNHQENDQDQDADQDVTQTNDQSEENIQANELDTGDNTATVAQSNDATQDVEADASAKASAEDDSDNHHSSDSHSSDSANADADAIVTATAEATVDQDSSIHDVDLNNNVAFGEDTNTQIAVPIIDQDQRAANLAANLAAQLDLDVTNVDEEEEEEVPPDEVPPDEEPPEEGVSFCFAIVGETTDPRCFDTLLECQLTRGNEVPPPGTEFTPCVEVGPG